MTRERIELFRSLAEKQPGEKSAAIAELCDEVERLWKARATQKPLMKAEVPLSLHKTEGFEAAWTDFVADRKERRKSLTSRAAKIILDRLSERPQRAVEALRKAIEKGWTSFHWDWLDRNGTLPGGGKRGEYSESKELPSGIVVKIGSK